MRIICVYKTGGDYDARYVEAFHSAVQKFIHTKFDFYCLTDAAHELSYIGGINILELKHNLPGWWSKIELFRPDISYEGTTIYFDLDVLLVKSIDRFVEKCIASAVPMMLRSCDPIGEQNDWPSSSIMSWKGRGMNRIYYEFVRQGNVIENSRTKTKRAGQQTDQGFIREIINPGKFQDVLLEDYIVFKYHYLQDPTLFGRCHILNWTGRPRFHKMGSNFSEIQSIWETRIKLSNQEKWKLKSHQY